MVLGGCSDRDHSIQQCRYLTTVALVDAGTITLRSEPGPPPWSNIGTTSTAWLVSLKLTGIGPFFIVLGAVLSAIPTRFKVLGKAAFDFGFIFFSLDLVSFTLKPLARVRYSWRY